MFADACDELEMAKTGIPSSGNINVLRRRGWLQKQRRSLPMLTSPFLRQTGGVEVLKRFNPIPASASDADFNSVLESIRI